MIYISYSVLFYSISIIVDCVLRYTIQSYFMLFHTFGSILVHVNHSRLCITLYYTKLLLAILYYSVLFYSISIRVDYVLHYSIPSYSMLSILFCSILLHINHSRLCISPYYTK